jgi:excisionase family DNA binding protein
LAGPEAGAYLGVHEETIRRWARSGAIPAAKLGNRGGFRFRREDLDQFLDARRTEGAGLS